MGTGARRLKISTQLPGVCMAFRPAPRTAMIRSVSPWGTMRVGSRKNATRCSMKWWKKSDSTVMIRLPPEEETFIMNGLPASKPVSVATRPSSKAMVMV